MWRREKDDNMLGRRSVQTARIVAVTRPGTAPFKKQIDVLCGRQVLDGDGWRAPTDGERTAAAVSLQCFLLPAQTIREAVTGNEVLEVNIFNNNALSESTRNLTKTFYKRYIKRAKEHQHQDTVMRSVEVIFDGAAQDGLQVAAGAAPMQQVLRWLVFTIFFAVAVTVFVVWMRFGSSPSQVAESQDPGDSSSTGGRNCWQIPPIPWVCV
jgi:hypothetical protein